jgi:hypothetical protein
MRYFNYLRLHLTSQIYKLHGFIPNLCEIYCFMGLCHLHTNVMHYLNTKIMCTTFVCKKILTNTQHSCLNNMNMHMTFMSKQWTWHQCSNNTNRWMTSMSIPYEPIKTNFARLLLPNHDPWSLWCRFTSLPRFHWVFFMNYIIDPLWIPPIIHLNFSRKKEELGCYISLQLCIYVWSLKLMLIWFTYYHLVYSYVPIGTMLKRLKSEIHLKF